MATQDPLRILVTGSSGFVGRAIKDHLKSLGHEVHGTVYSRPGDERDVVLNLGADDPTAALSGDFDVIVHAAATLNDLRFDAPTRAVNVGGTERMLTFAKARGCQHFIQVSSVAAYGIRCAGVDRDENTKLSVGGSWNPLETEYMRSKADAERRVVASGLPYSILRMPVVIGAGSSFSAPAMLPALASGALPYFGRNDSLVSVLCVSSTGQAVAAFLAKGPQNAAYNVCDHHLPWNALVQLYADATKREVSWQRQGPWAWVRALRDAFYGFWIGNGYLGAHYPTGKLEALGVELRSDLADAVRDEVSGGLAGAASY